MTGCARSEGYYAISRKEKDVYLDLDLPEQVIREVENVDTSVSSFPTAKTRSHLQAATHDDRGSDHCRWSDFTFKHLGVFFL